MKVGGSNMAELRELVLNIQNESTQVKESPSYEKLSKLINNKESPELHGSINKIRKR